MDSSKLAVSEMNKLFAELLRERAQREYSYTKISGGELVGKDFPCAYM